MKYFNIVIILLLLASCEEMNPKDSNIPWYISERIKTGLIENYNYTDSLKKYQLLEKTEISNKNKYDSYLIDLEFKIGNKSKSELKQSLDILSQKDQNEFCNKLIKPALEYIAPQDRPYRRYSKPYITDLDFDYFIEQCIQCNFIIDSLNTNYEISILTLSDIMLKDQWFRIPSRPRMPDIQERYDMQNMNRLDKLYMSNMLHLQEDDTRSKLYILLLHSTDCDWTKKWLKIYFENCSNYPKYVDDLNHFLRRSTCESDEIISMVKDEIKKH